MLYVLIVLVLHRIIYMYAINHFSVSDYSENSC